MGSLKGLPLGEHGFDQKMKCLLDYEILEVDILT